MDTPTYYFKLTLAGADAAGFFKECSGLSAPAPDQKFTGEMKWQNITLKRGVDANAELWTWRKLVIDGMIDDAREDGTIELVDWKGDPVITYSFKRGWPCKYSAPGMNAGGNEILVEAGQVTVEIGIAPVKPAEFIVFRISQFQAGEAG